MQFFKKFFGLAIAIVAVFALVSCESVFQEAVEKFTAGISTEASSFELNVGDKFEPLQGLTAIDATGKDMLDQVVVSHLVPLDENGCVTQSGTYQIKYLLDINGEKYNLYRTLTVIYVLPETDDLVKNGDFATGSVDPFTKSEYDNGAATLSAANKELKIEITAVSWQESSPRVETNAFTVEAGQYYKASFKGRAEEARTVYVQVGQLLPAAPWFYQLGAQYVDLSTEMEEHEVVFQAVSDGTIDLTQIQLLFGFGTVSQGSAAVTTCYLDDIKVEKTKIASLLNVEAARAGGDEAAALAAPGTGVLWYVQDAGWNCGPAFEASVTAENGDVHIVSGQTAESPWFATQLFAYATNMTAGNYTLSFDLDINAAGKVTLQAERATQNAYKAEVFDVVSGKNSLALTFDADGENIGMALQFGVDGVGCIGAFEATISNILLVRNGDINNIDYADPANLLGKIAGAENEGEKVARANPNNFYVWYVKDAGWQCGPAVTCEYKYEAGALTVKPTLVDNEHWWFATQVFYATKPIEKAGDHTFTMVLDSTAAGDITLNGVKTHIETGVNKLAVPFSNGAGEQFVLSLQFGWEEKLDSGETTSHVVAGANTFVISNMAIDGVAAEYDGAGQGGEQPSTKDITLYTEGTGNQAIHVEGAGAWIWIVPSSVGMTGENFGQFTITAKSALGVANAFASDVTETFARVYVVLNRAPAADEEFDIAISLVLGDDTYEKTVTFVGTKLKGAAEPEPTPEPTDTKDITLYTEGTGNQAIHVEGAGAWIWIVPSSVGMTGANFGQFQVTAKSALGVANAFVSDVTETFARVYVVLNRAPAADEEFDIAISLVLGDNAYAKTVTFVGTALKA